METVRVAFMGTPDFAVPSLQALLALQGDDDLSLSVVSVITQPDRPAGRGGRVRESPVKQAARAAGLPIWQPERLRQSQAVALLRDLAPDVIVVAAFAQILPPSVLAIPRWGCLNVHASLLPFYRGASPISAALLNGEATAGVTIMLMDSGLDTGPLLTTATTPVEPEETTGTLTLRLAASGADLLSRTLLPWLHGALTPTPQESALASLTRPLTRADGEIVWGRTAAQTERAVRAYQPWPGAFTTWNDVTLKVLAARVHPGDAPPGAVLDERESRTAVPNSSGPAPLVIGTGADLLEILVLQEAGGRAMLAATYLAGHRHLRGARLGRSVREESLG